MTERYQPRERATGQFGFVKNWARKCLCGHELGVHAGESPHDCLNEDRKHITSDTDDWIDRLIQPGPCDCKRFRLSRSKRL